MQSYFEEYSGGTIFIDEAYALNDNSPDGQTPYGEEAVNDLIVGLQYGGGIGADYPQNFLGKGAFGCFWADERLRKLFTEKENEKFSNGRYCWNLVKPAISKK